MAILNLKTVMVDYIVAQSILSDFEIEKIKELHEKEKNMSDVGRVGGNGGKSSYDNKIRESTVSWMDENFLQRNNCYDIWNKINHQVNELNNQFFMFELLFTQPIQITKYDSSNKGFYAPHIDCENYQDNIPRKLSFVIQLSDLSDFDGGEFICYKTGITECNVTKENPESMKKGNIILFPSFLPHGVTPVTRGTRYSLVGWVCGPRFK